MSHTLTNGPKSGVHFRELAKYTFRLFVATVALAIATAVMAHLGWRQARDTKKLHISAKKSADAAMKSAIVAESALVGTEAPFIFGIVEFPLQKHEAGTPFRSSNACYILRNYGRSPAIVREVYVSCNISSGVPDPVRFPPLQSQLFKDEVVAAGAGSEPQELNEIARLRKELGRNCAVFVVGQVRYADVFDNQYLSGFCYALNDKSESFYAIGGEAHNYRRKMTEEEACAAEARDYLSGRRRLVQRFTDVEQKQD